MPRVAAARTAIGSFSRPTGPRLAKAELPAAELGRVQQIEVGYYSGRANIRMWLTAHDLPCHKGHLTALWELAKKCDSMLSEEAIRQHLGV